MDKNGLYTKTKLSEMVGWSEPNGRRWVKIFKEYIPYVEYNNRIMYTNESIRILQFLKDLGETGLSTTEIKKWVIENGIPDDEKESKQILDNNKMGKVSYTFDEKIAQTIPSNKEILIPYLKSLSDNKPKSASDITSIIVDEFNLGENQQVMRYETGQDSIFLTRIRSVRFSLKKEGYIEEVNKLTYQITEDGRELLTDSSKEIESEIEELDKVIDPLTIIKENISDLSEQLADTLLKQLQNVHWIRFEDIVVELLTEMGYGDGEVSQRRNDEGLDGIIKEDKLGLENIYVQAKRWGIGNSVARDTVQGFSGALDTKGARKGVFITTSHFTKGAKEYVDRLEAKKIILIDGIELASLMISHNVGVDNKMKFVVKDIDYDYFKDE